MAHSCEACLITCEDFRLHQRKDGRNYIAEFIKNEGVDCDVITRAGGIQDLVRPPKNGFCESLLRDAEVSAKLHAAKMAYLVNHTDCGAYAPLALSGKEEIAQHESDLWAAKAILEKNFPQLAVKICLAELQPATSDVFALREIAGK
jgi:hypothetical protein